MKHFFLFITIFFFRIAESQNEKALIPFQKEGKWGYCDENLKIIISPEFDDANLFKNGVAIVIENSIDTLWTEIATDNGLENNSLNKKYILYTKQKKGVINTNGKKLIEPFIGEVEINENFIICNFGHYRWMQQDSTDKEGNSLGITNYTKFIEIDSSCVINKDGNILLPFRNGVYTKMTENCINWDKNRADSFDENADKQTEYYYNGKLFWTSSEKNNIPRIQCNEFCCYNKTDQIINIIGFDGKSKGTYTTEDTRSIEPIDYEKLCIDQGDSYKVIDLKGVVLENGLFWLNSLKDYNIVKLKLEKEKWRNTFINKYRIYRKEIIFMSNNWVLTKSYEFPAETYFYINKESPYIQFGPFTYVTSFFNGLAYVQELNSDILIQIDEKGQKTGKNIPINKVIFEINNQTERLQPTSFLRIKDHSNSSSYYHRADGKNFIIN